MNDKFEFRIPFKAAFVASTEEGDAGLVDIKSLSLENLKCSISRVDGEYVVQNLDHPWESIPTSFTPMAVKVFKGSENYWPYVKVKASPAKVLQGHNVFGPDCPALCGTEILISLKLGLPEVSRCLDFSYTRIINIDCTYSIPFENSSIARSVLEVIRNVKHKQLKLSQGIYDETVYFNQGSEHGCLAIYMKGQEVQKQLKDLVKLNRDGCNNKMIAILSDERLLSYAERRLRFEARLTQRKLKDMGIPTLWVDFCKFYKSEAAENRNLMRTLFWSKMRPLFEALEGSDVNVYNDDEVRTKIRAANVRVRKDGSLNYDPAMKAFLTYRSIVADGFIATKEIMAKSTFNRHIKMIVDSDIPKAALQAIQPHSNKNVVPMVHFVKIDFDNQFPSWYEEPISQFDNVTPIGRASLINGKLSAVV